MPAVVKLDGSKFEALAKQMGGTEQAFDYLVPAALNEAGRSLYRDIVYDIYDKLEHKVPQSIIKDAVNIRSATDLVSAYSINAEGPYLPYYRWLTKNDEKVCPICGPRQNEIYPVDIMEEIFPAHPNCRCSFEQIEFTPLLLEAGANNMETAVKRAMDEIMSAFTRL
jgi:SPP1 gp7 family putative phage head morphogenesis protein